jgi:hypothetical protein
MTRYYVYVHDVHNGHNGSSCTQVGCAIVLICIAVAVASSYFVTHPINLDTSPSGMARSTIQQYYDAVNKKDYRTAYNLWQNNATGRGQPYDQFAAGYENTLHDDITFNNIIVQRDNTVNVNITIQATERDGKETFIASYVVGNVGGSWKILSGYIEKTG